MATLTNTKIKDTYDGLLKTTDNDVIDATGVTLIEDGLGNASAISIGRANNGVTITGALTASGLSYPTTDGTVAGQAIVTDAAGNLSFATVTAATPTLDEVTAEGATSSVNVTINGADLGTITSSSNTLFGDGALASHTSGSSNTAIGRNALTAYTSGSYNTAIGAGTLDVITSGQRNTAVGYNALGNGTTQNYNTAIGNDALFYINGLYNVALGHNAGKIRLGGSSKSAGDSNIYIGSNTVSSAADTDNEIVIGANATGNGSNSATYGDSNVTKHIFTGGNVGIGTQSPSAGAVGGKVLHLVNSGATASIRVDRSDASTSGTLSILSGNTTNGIFSTGSKDLTISTNSTEAMRIDSSGTTYIQATKAYGSQTAALRVQTIPTGTNYADGAFQNIVFGNESVANEYLGQIAVVQENASASTASTMRFYTNSGGGNGGTSERMRIDSSGNVIAKAGTIQVNRSDDQTQYGIFGQDSSGGYVSWHRPSASLYENFRFIATNTSGSTERMRIDSDGNVGIGESNPTAVSSGATTLTIKGSTTTKGGALLLRSSDNSISSYIYPDSTNGLTFGSLSNHNVRFISNSAERMRITSGGDVLIGTQGLPNGTTYYGSGFRADSNSRRVLKMASSSSSAQDIIEFYNPNGRVGYIQMNGTATQYVESGSDLRLKKNIEDWSDSVLNDFATIEPKLFHFNQQQDTEEKIKGYIAQDMIDKFPEAYPQGEDGFLGYNPSGMVVYLIKAVKELTEKVEQLESQLNA